MNSKYLVYIAATVLVMFFLFSKDKKNADDQTQENEIEENISDQKNSLAVPVKPALVSTDVSGNTLTTATPPEGPRVSDQVQQQFSMHLKAMAKCLALAAPQSIGEKTEPTVENLFANLTSNLGEMVMQMDDWSQTEFIDQGGVRKRVRVDYDYPDNTTPVRRLSMYMINSYNMPEIMSLSADEMNNPNEAYIASLTEGRELTTVEKGSRAYFSDAEELIFSTKNGLLHSVSINKADHSFNCFNLGEEGSSCSCP
ncbi:MAG: hypothetical protein AABY53_05130 [Bdellovibrionota bacterium]